MKKSIDLTKNGQCSRCGGCCASIIPATNQEIAAAHDYAVTHGYKPALPKDANLVYLQCPYLKKHKGGTTSCAVYPARPSICRVFLCSLTPTAGIQAFLSQKGDPNATPVNLWESWGQTGIRLNGHTVTTQNAAQAHLELDDGRILDLRQGQAVRPIPHADDPMEAGMILGFTPNGIYFTNGPSGIIELKYDDLDDIRT